MWLYKRVRPDLNATRYVLWERYNLNFILIWYMCSSFRSLRWPMSSQRELHYISYLSINISVHAFKRRSLCPRTTQDKLKIAWGNAIWNSKQNATNLFFCNLRAERPSPGGLAIQHRVLLTHAVDNVYESIYKLTVIYKLKLTADGKKQLGVSQKVEKFLL